MRVFQRRHCHPHSSTHPTLTHTHAKTSFPCNSHLLSPWRWCFGEVLPWTTAAVEWWSSGAALINFQMAPLCSLLRVDLAPPPPPITPLHTESLPHLHLPTLTPPSPHPQAPIRHGSCARAASLCLPASFKINIHLRRLRRHLLWIKLNYGFQIANKRQPPPLIWAAAVVVVVANMVNMELLL